MKEFIDNLEVCLPGYRVLDREENLNFYREVLGLKVLHEENAEVFLAGYTVKEPKIILEESPGLASVQGVKKHGRTVIQADGDEIEQLLARNIDKVSHLYQVKDNWAFEAVSPENDVFLMVSVEDWSDLVEVDKSDVDFDEGEFLGLSDFSVKEVQINIEDKAIVTAYEHILGVKAVGNSIELPNLRLVFYEGEGPNLSASVDEKLDLMLLRFQVSQDFDLVRFAESLSTDKLYLDRKAKTLAVDIPQHMELWFTKQGL
ncbi:proteinase [Lactococcus garvieae]|nr:proteinase [Lactococcus garvieae]